MLNICKEQEAEIIKGHVLKNHVYLFVSVPPHLAISRLVQYLNGKSSYKLLQENKQLSKKFWDRHLWASGYFVATFGNITNKMIIECIKNQEEGRSDEDLTITEGL